MFERLNSPVYLSRMLTQAASTDDDLCDVLQPVLLVCIALLDPKAPRTLMAAPPGAFGMMQAFDAQPSPEVEEARRAARAIAAAEIMQFVPEFTELLTLSADAAAEAQEQPYGTLLPPLGRQRLTVVELGRALVCTGEPDAIREVLKSEFLGRVMELFKAYPFNNILHMHVRDILGALILVMSSDPEPKPAPPPPVPEVPAPGPGPPGAPVMPAPPLETPMQIALREMDPAVRAELAAQVQECLFDNVSILNWLMDMSELADSSTYRVRLLSRPCMWPHASWTCVARPRCCERVRVLQQQHAACSRGPTAWTTHRAPRTTATCWSSRGK